MKKTFLITMALLSITMLHAQLGRFDKLSKPKSKKAKVMAPMIYNDQMPVSVDFKYIIEEIKLDPDGWLLHRYYRVTFPPLNDADGLINYEDNYRFFMQVTKEGKEIYKLPCKVLHDNEKAKVFMADQMNPTFENSKVQFSEGSYSFNYYLDDSLFYNIPFTITSVKSDDPYAETSTQFMINGPWNDLVYISVQKDDNNLIFNKYIRHESVEKLSKCSYWFDLLRDGDRVGGSCREKYKGQKYVSNVKCEWQNLSSSFMEFDSNGEFTNKYINAKELQDGEYEIIASVNEVISKYKFTVKEGRIVPSGNQIYDEKNSKHYLEGVGKNFFFTEVPN